MKGLIVNLVVGIGLFAGALVGGLAATGRLDHDGVANIPVLNRLFPPPAASVGDPNSVPGTAVTDVAGTAMPAAAHGNERGAVADAAHAGRPEDPQGQGPGTTAPLKRGRSIFDTEGKGEAGGNHGGGGGHEAEADKGGAHGASAALDAAPTAPENQGVAGHDTDPAERDFDQLTEQLAGDRASRYAPGGYFRFEGMPAGVTPEQLDSAWRSVQQVMSDLTKRGQALDLREKELREFADDIARRQTELGKERLEIENLQRRLDERIDQFQEQVKLVRTDEVAGLKRNAQTIASFEPSKAAELVTEQWKLEAGQDEVLKTFEFMDREAVNAILEALPNAMIREVMQKRLKISKEPMPSAKAPK